MFTGLVQATGRIGRAASGVVLRWQAAKTAWGPAALQLGDSVSVDGVCLTVPPCWRMAAVFAPM
jgi:riboflavin synthase alpha subunit